MTSRLSSSRFSSALRIDGVTVGVLEIATHGGIRDTKRATKLTAVQHIAVRVCEPLPEPAHGHARYLDAEGQHRIVEPREILRVLQVEVYDRPAPRRTDVFRQRGLADLPRAEKRDNRRLPQQAPHASVGIETEYIVHTLKIRRCMPNFEGDS